MTIIVDKIGNLGHTLDWSGVGRLDLKPPGAERRKMYPGYENLPIEGDFMRRHGSCRPTSKADHKSVPTEDAVGQVMAIRASMASWSVRAAGVEAAL